MIMKNVIKNGYVKNVQNRYVEIVIIHQIYNINSIKMIKII